MQKEMAYSNSFLSIIADGAISTEKWGEGRLIPVIIVDTSKHSDVRNLINIHQHTPPGDVHTTWALKRLNNKQLFLKLEFERPVNTICYLTFDLTKHADLVSGIMISRAIYLQPLESGASVSEGISNPKILIEVSAELDQWKKMYKTTLLKKYKALIHTKNDAHTMTDEHIKRITELWSARRQR